MILSTATRAAKLTIVSFTLILLSALMGQSQTFTNFAALDNQLHATITNVHTPDHLLLESIGRLGRVTEPPSFWTQIADNANYSLRHRARAVFALFRRHGQRCGDIPDLRRCLTPGEWLKQSRVEKVPFVFGKLPVEVHPGELVYSISVLYGPKIYMRTRGDIDYETFVSQLRGEGSRQAKSDLTILQYGYGDDYEEWLAQPQSCP